MLSGLLSHLEEKMAISENRFHRLKDNSLLHLPRKKNNGLKDLDTNFKTQLIKPFKLWEVQFSV